MVNRFARVATLTAAFAAFAWSATAAPSHDAAADIAAIAEELGCVGTDLLSIMPDERRQVIDRAVEATPYSKGIRWSATKDDARIEIVGTYHFPDSRHDTRVKAMTPIIEEAAALLVEAGPEEEAKLEDTIAKDPMLLVETDGPTLPERLDAAEWAKLSEAMADRGIPAIMLSKMQPWYVSMMLGISPCMISSIQSAEDVDGLDNLLLDVAEGSDTPVVALEPWDTVLSLFDDMTPEEELDMVRAALPAALLADDYLQTTADAYFRGDIWAIWEFGKLDAYESSGLSRAAVDRQIALAQERLMVNRNESWIPVLTKAALDAAQEKEAVVAAFGALHLPGEKGVLNLLEDEGWTISPVDDPL